MNEVINQLQNVNLESLGGTYAEKIEWIRQVGMIPAIVILAVAVLTCFFGWKLIRVWGALSGFEIGAAIGAIAGSVIFGINEKAVFAAMAGAVIGLILFAVWKRGAVFVVTLIFGLNSVLGVVGSKQLLVTGIVAVVSLILAIVAEFFSAPVVILLSSIYGGILTGVSVGALVPSFSLISYIAGVVATVLGIVVQFMLESRKKVKQNVAKAKRIRDAESTENEVDRARYIIDHLDEVEDEVEYDEDDEYLDDEYDDEDDEYLEDEEEYDEDVEYLEEEYDEDDEYLEDDEYDDGDVEYLDDEEDDEYSEDEEDGEEVEYLEDDEEYDDEDVEYLDDEEYSEDDTDIEYLDD